MRELEMNVMASRWKVKLTEEQWRRLVSRFDPVAFERQGEVNVPCICDTVDRLCGRCPLWSGKVACKRLYGEWLVENGLPIGALRLGADEVVQGIGTTAASVKIVKMIREILLTAKEVEDERAGDEC